MDNTTLNLPWGNDILSLSLPPAWRVEAVLEPKPLLPVTDLGGEVRRTLAAPLGAARLAGHVRKDWKIALIIDDDSRPTPVAEVLPHLFAELEQAGVSLDQVTVVTALGVHRPMSAEEVKRRVGAAWLEGSPNRAPLKWENHDCDDPQKLVNLGTTRRGVPVLIQKTVAEADFVISVGCIEPHTIASFGGGYKNVIPGVAGRATIAANHALNCRPETFNSSGRPIQDNPMRLDLEEGASLLKPEVFILNAVLNSQLEVVKIVCGHPIQAHREGAQICAQIYGAAAPCLGDVVITTSHPMDQDLRQGVKALANNIRAVRPGGTMIVLIRAEEGMGVFGLAQRKLPLGRTALRLLAPLLLPLIPALKMKGMGEEDKFFLYFALQALRRCNLLLYAPTIPSAMHAALPFVRFTSSPEAALALADKLTPGARRVLVIPHGGSTYPILP